MLSHVYEYVLYLHIYVYGTSKVVLGVKNMTANAGDMREAGSVPGLEDPLEEGVSTHSSILAWRIPWTEELG